MKKIKYIAGLIFILTGLNLVGQESMLEQDVKVERIPDPVEVSPSSAMVNNVPISDTPLGNNRLIFWLHGLGGDGFSWSTVSADIQGRYDIVSVINLTYSTTQLHSAGVHLNNDIGSEAAGTNNPDPASNFIIAHSQGGLVSRAGYKSFIEDDSDLNNPLGYGGIVTFGTPHQGAQIINNIPMLESFISSSCDVLTSGPVLEEWNGNWILAMFSSNGMENIVTGICTFIGFDLVPFMMNDFTPSITDDYKVGAPYLAALNEFDSNLDENSEDYIHKVAFYGVEESPVVWRTSYSLLNDVNSKPAYEADEDTELIGIANENQNSYYAKYMCWSDLYDQWTPLWWVKQNRYETRNAYRDGYHWWLNIEEEYLTLIGATYYEIVGCRCDCEEETSEGGETEVTFSQYVIDCDDNCSAIEDDLWDDADMYTTVDCQKVAVEQAFFKLNDGIVLVESAKDYPGADNGDDNVMFETNHLQMRNHSQTKVKLDGLLLGFNGLFFETD